MLSVLFRQRKWRMNLAFKRSKEFPKMLFFKILIKKKIVFTLKCFFFTQIFKRKLNISFEVVHMTVFEFFKEIKFCNLGNCKIQNKCTYSLSSSWFWAIFLRFYFVLVLDRTRTMFGFEFSLYKSYGRG